MFVSSHSRSSLHHPHTSFRNRAGGCYLDDSDTFFTLRTPLFCVWLTNSEKRQRDDSRCCDGSYSSLNSSFAPAGVPFYVTPYCHLGTGYSLYGGYVASVPRLYLKRTSESIFLIYWIRIWYALVPMFVGRIFKKTIMRGGQSLCTAGSNCSFMQSTIYRTRHDCHTVSILLDVSKGTPIWS